MYEKQPISDRENYHALSSKNLLRACVRIHESVSRNTRKSFAFQEIAETPVDTGKTARRFVSFSFARVKWLQFFFIVCERRMGIRILFQNVATRIENKFA